MRQRTLLVVADGAGGRAGGGAAADEVIRAARTLVGAQEATNWIAWLEDIDARLQNVGETTAVLALCTNGAVRGASVGDSGVWLISATGYVDLSGHQRCKPLLGSGSTLPVPFGPYPFDGRLLLASDGLFNYVSATQIQRLVRTLSIEAATAALIEAARLPSGALCDDIAVIVAG